MVRRLLLALLVLFAGCTAGNSVVQPTPTSDTASPAETPTPPPTPTPTDVHTARSGTTTSRVVSADSPPTDRNTVDYTNLSATQRRAFDREVEGDVQFVDRSALDSPYVGAEYFARQTAEPFRHYEYVRKNGTRHRLTYREGGGDVLATYGIRTTERQPPADASVVAVENLSTPVRKPIRWAVENGSYGVPAGKWDSLPPEFDRFEYVRFSGRTYRVTVVHGDWFADSLVAERVET